MPRPVVLGLVFVLSAGPVLAGAYSPDEKCPFAIGPDGTAEELSFTADGFGRWPLEFGRLADIGNPRSVKTSPTEPTAREKVEERIATRMRVGSKEPAEVAALAVDLMRVRRPDGTRRTDEALNVLAPRSRDRRPDFRVLATLGHVHAIRGEWAEAIRYHEAARLDAEFPKDLAGTTPEQRAWLKKVEEKYYPRWLKGHRQEADARVPPADEGPFPLFDGPPPADAVAVIQQLLLWNPDDVRLYWLLADRYAATNRPRQAERILDELVEGRQQSNRSKLMEQRTAVKRAVAELAAATPPSADPPPTGPQTLEDLGLTPAKLVMAGVAAGIAVIGLLVLQVRAVRRRRGT